MTNEERMALVHTVRLEATLNERYDRVAYVLLEKIADTIEADGKRIEELEAALVKATNEINALKDVLAQPFTRSSDT